MYDEVGFKKITGTLGKGRFLSVRRDLQYENALLTFQ
jgi:hypothetical protein